jgi:hypothetical protein
MPSEDRDRAARLLLKALKTLPERDRDFVLKCFFTGRMGAGSLIPFADPSVPTRALRQQEQPLLVRLPVDLHDRFRRWATTHGFTMASVVRGLLERFLDQQEAATGRRS